MMDNPRNLEQEDILDFIDQWLDDQNETTEITKTVAFNLEEPESEQAEESENLENLEKLVINDTGLDLLKPSKGQMKSEYIYEIIDFPKYHRKNLIDFCPESLFRLGMLCTHLSRVALRIIKANCMYLA